MPQLGRLNRRILTVEALLLLTAVLYYELGNFSFRAEKALADANAIWLWNLEVDWGLFVEPHFQEFFEAHPFWMGLLVFFYVGPHFLLTLGFLAWAYWYRFPRYTEVRDSMLAFTFLAFGFQWFVPLSPPRFIPAAGLQDTLDHTLPLNGNTPWIFQFTNPYAALPSVHFGWAFLVALLAIRLTSSPWRWTWLAYPFAIALSIMATGNHWILDIVVSAAFILATETALVLGRRLATRQLSSQVTVPMTAGVPLDAKP
ncbi:MAG TPA: phosphatase PAP2 family protein [Candidatus Thermoplasmatota archaeon]|nr:phosphatase PAP2 family protein [Candidatus Thermoplasmatota archaeon]